VLVLTGLTGGRLARARGTAETALAALCILAVAASLPAPHFTSFTEAGSERVSPYERTLAGWLKDHAEPGDMILSPLWPPTLLQAKTGHPVLVDIMTLMSMTYVPEVAPAVGVLVRDVFGIDYTRPDQLERLVGPDGMLRPTSPVWLAAWEKRTCEDWDRLAGRYGFRWVLAPRRIPLALPAALPGPTWTLYAVPRDGGCERSAGG
jgi:hypothetical protein